MQMMQLEATCLKIDKPNAKAMVHGFRKNGKIHRQSIWLAVKDRPFPALLTLMRTRTGFKLSPTGEALGPEKDIEIPLKYVAALDCEYFIRNEMPLWATVCSNSLFDIWDPGAPSHFFAIKKSEPAKFRIQLLRIYEIVHEFHSNDISSASDWIDQLVSPIREVAIRRPLISDDDFTALTDLLERSVTPYLTRSPRPAVSLPPGAQCVTDTTVREDIDSLELENEYFEGERTPRLSSFYERNPRLRAAAVHHHGTVCKICGFDFGEVYGTHGHGFVEVHHLIPVSSLTESRRVDPVSEMTVVCSNCHRMIHRRRDSVLTPDQLREIVTGTHEYNTEPQGV